MRGGDREGKQVSLVELMTDLWACQCPLSTAERLVFASPLRLRYVTGLLQVNQIKIQNQHNYLAAITCIPFR